MNKQMKDTNLPPSSVSRFELTAEERILLAKDRYEAKDRKALSRLYDPFAGAFFDYTARGYSEHFKQANLGKAFRFCAHLMLELDGSYWAFNWQRLLEWRAAALETAKAANCSKVWHWDFSNRWSLTTSTLFFLGALPYNEAIYQTHHRVLAEKWLGAERANEISEQFVQTALSIGYKDKKTLYRNGSGVLLSVLVYTGKRDAAELTKVDLENWQAQTNRSKRVARASVTCIQRVLAAMNNLGGEAPRLTGLKPPEKFGWGRTASQIVATFERFLADLLTIRASGTVNTYRVSLRRFGDWLGESFPELESISELRRTHIEAFKRAVKEMRCGDYTNVGTEFRTINYGEPLSQHHRLRSLSCVRSFCDRIDALEYDERPNRQLWMRGDTPRIDEQLPRAIPDADWQKLLSAVNQLSTESAVEHRLPEPFERTQAIFAVLFESGLRAGELCRLDTGCLVATENPQTGEKTHWLRVPVGKLHNDRLIPVRPVLVQAIDAWMKVRGQQPLAFDKRENKPRDMLFTYKGHPLSPHQLNRMIRRLCLLAKTKGKYSSHCFRHTLAVQWRARGMRIESISRMLGHKDLKMTMRYAAVMPPLLRQEFETAFAQIDEEHRVTAQVRVLLSPEAHVEAQTAWRESLFVDLGIGWCGLTAYHPCETRLACHSCPNFLADKESLPLLKRQRSNLIELRGLTTEKLPMARQKEAERELTRAIDGLDKHLNQEKEAAGKKEIDE